MFHFGLKKKKKKGKNRPTVGKHTKHNRPHVCERGFCVCVKFADATAAVDVLIGAILAPKTPYF